MEPSGRPENLHWRETRVLSFRMGAFSLLLFPVGFPVLLYKSRGVRPAYRRFYWWWALGIGLGPVVLGIASLIWPILPPSAMLLVGAWIFVVILGAPGEPTVSPAAVSAEEPT